MATAFNADSQNPVKYSSVKCNWVLHRYARLKSSENSNDENSSWEHHDSTCTASQISISILNCNRMIITQGHRILENHDLFLYGKYLRVIIRGDSMAFVYKIGKNHREFRIRFASTTTKSGAKNCNECSIELAKFISIKDFTHPSQSQTPANETTRPISLSFDSAVSDLSKYFLNPSEYSLPYVLKPTPIPSNELKEIISLCLSDSTFPAFVAQVDEALKGLTED